MKSEEILQNNYQEAPFSQGRYPGVDELLAQGKATLQEGLLEEAETWLEEARQKDPFHAGVHNALSIVYRRKNMREAELSCLVRALELDPNDQEIILNCSKTFSELGRTEDAIEIMGAFLERNPWDGEVQSELDRITRSKSTALPATPSHRSDEAHDLGNVFNEQGEIQFEQGKLEHAKACFEMALEHNPALAVAHSNLGVLCWRQGELEAALDHFNRALELDPEDLDIIYNSSKALAAAGELETASNFLRLYLQRNPRDEEAWNDYTSLIRSTADSHWQPAGLNGEVSQVYLEMGRALTEVKDFIGAGQAYQRAIQLNAEQGEPFWGLAQLHMELGQEEEALEILRPGLQVDPAHKPCVLLAGKILAGRKELPEARTLYEKYLEKDTDEEVQAALEALDDLAEASDD